MTAALEWLTRQLAERLERRRWGCTGCRAFGSGRRALRRHVREAHS